MFDKYPVITYNNQKIVDISRRFIIENIETNNSSYYLYTMTDWKSPEELAYDIYGSCDYEWVIRVANNTDTIFDNLTFDSDEEVLETNQLWMIKDTDMHDYIYYKYPIINYINKFGEQCYLDYAQQPHHFVDSNNNNNLQYKFFETNRFSPIYMNNNINNLELFINKNNLTIQPDIRTLKEGFEKDIFYGYTLYKNGEALETISNYDFELQLNEQRRTVKIIYKVLLDSILEQVDKMFNKSK